MLGSITPLGERGRNQRYGVTVAAHVVGGAAGGAALGSVLGWIGSAPPAAPGSPTARLAALLALVALAAAFDLGLFGIRVPSVRRQVNEEWLHRYRGWVYGISFGAQLGVGFATVATTGAVHAAFGAALLSGSPATGGAIGSTFGLVRSVMLLSVAGVRRPDQLLAVDAHLRSLDRPARALAVALEVGVLAAGIVALL